VAENDRLLGIAWEVSEVETASPTNDNFVLEAEKGQNDLLNRDPFSSSIWRSALNSDSAMFIAGLCSFMIAHRVFQEKPPLSIRCSFRSPTRESSQEAQANHAIHAGRQTERRKIRKNGNSHGRCSADDVDHRGTDRHNHSP